MPNLSRDPISLLLAGVRRRMFVARLSRAAVTALFGGTVWLAICCVLAALSQTISSWLALLGLGLAIGGLLIDALRRSPADVAVAMHIDRSLGLDELLSSAVAMNTRSDSASVTLRTIANHVARQIDPNEVSVSAPSARRTLAAALSSGAMLSVFLLTTAGRARTAVTIVADHHEPSAAKSPASESIGGTNVAKPSAASEPRPGDVTREPTSDDASSMRVNRETESETAKTAADVGKARGQTTDQPKSAALAFGSTKDAPVANNGQKDSSASGRDAESSAKTSESMPFAGASAERTAIAASSARLQATPDRSDLGPAIADAPPNCRDIVRAYFDSPDETSKPIQR